MMTDAAIVAAETMKDEEPIKADEPKKEDPKKDDAAAAPSGDS